MTVIEYIQKLPNADEFLALETGEQEKWIFQATETLNDHLSSRNITTRVIALQALFSFESESEDFAMYKRQGIERFNADGMSIEFKTGQIAPAVLDIVDKKGIGSVGRIV